MREIHKKINPEYFEKILSGEKTFEFRVADFECKPGDILVLEEWEYPGGVNNVENRRPTGRVIRKKVGYVGYTKDFTWLTERPDVAADYEKLGAQIISLIDDPEVPAANEDATASLLQNVDCVSFQVDNLDDGIKFYCDSLGLKLLWRTQTSCGLKMSKDITEVVLTTARENTVVQFKVDSVAEAIDRFVEAGGSVVVPIFDINIGKCTVVKDKWDNEYCLLDMTKGHYMTNNKGEVTGVEK